MADEEDDNDTDEHDGGVSSTSFRGLHSHRSRLYSGSFDLLHQLVVETEQQDERKTTDEDQIEAEVVQTSKSGVRAQWSESDDCFESVRRCCSCK